MNVRKTALEQLCRIENENRFVNLSLSHAYSCVDEADKALLVALIYGVTEKRITLDYYISVLSGRQKDKIEQRTKNILRLGLYQLMYMDKIPAFAAVNESVKLTRNKGEASFVNGVLRAYERRRDELCPPKREKNLARHLAIRYSFPLWIVKHFISEYSEDEAEEILGAFCKAPPLSLRVNTLKTTREELLSRLKENGLNAEASPLAPNGILIYDSINPTSLSGFLSGEFFVQDTASQIETEALRVKENDLIIDVCACPGGKSFGAAIACKNKAKIISLDLHESKMGLVTEGAERLGIDCIETRVHDSRLAIEEYKGQADCVICDVPCSGLGVLAKKPDLRHRDTDFEELSRLACEIFEASSEYVREGGCLVFSTCTLNRRENEEAVESFLARHNDFTPEDFSVGELRSERGMLTLLPHKHGCDGFFIARLVRK